MDEARPFGLLVETREENENFDKYNDGGECGWLQ